MQASGVTSRYRVTFIGSQFRGYRDAPFGRLTTRSAARQGLGPEHGHLNPNLNSNLNPNLNLNLEPRT